MHNQLCGYGHHFHGALTNHHPYNPDRYKGWRDFKYERRLHGGAASPLLPRWLIHGHGNMLSPNANVLIVSIYPNVMIS
jgi:hypothetical protein